ncbi:MAG: hypothetical protein CMJ51_06045 [Planctomycetaceae bacterium]|nr:hypothetical protein [Planctomycetaceae bacterium]
MIQRPPRTPNGVEAVVDSFRRRTPSTDRDRFRVGFRRLSDDVSPTPAMEVDFGSGSRRSTSGRTLSTGR